MKILMAKALSIICQIFQKARIVAFYELLVVYFFFLELLKNLDFGLVQSDSFWVGILFKARDIPDSDNFLEAS